MKDEKYFMFGIKILTLLKKHNKDIEKTIDELEQIEGIKLSEENRIKMSKELIKLME